MYIMLVTKIRNNEIEWEHVIKSNVVGFSLSEIFHTVLTICARISNHFF